MKKRIFIAIVVLGFMELAAFHVYQKSKEAAIQEVKLEQEGQAKEQNDKTAPQTTTTKDTKVDQDETAAENTSASEYPKVTTERVNGRTERTIHMGVRQWAWEPSTLRVKQGELVRLVIHNADVDHPLYIPELGIEADVPPEGAVVEFEAKQKGNFSFFCGRYCGEGHAEMQGTLTIE